MFTYVLATIPFLARIRRARTAAPAAVPSDTVNSIALDTVNSIADRLDHIHDYLLGRTPELHSTVSAPRVAVSTAKPPTTVAQRDESHEALAA